MKNLNFIFKLILFPILFLKKLNIAHIIMISLTIIITNGQLYAACSDYTKQNDCVGDATCTWSGSGNSAICIDTPTATPIVTNAILNVNENANDNTLVGTVSTTGGDPTSFEIVSGNNDGFFQIDNNGVITTNIPNNSPGIDYETTPSYTLSVRADNVLGEGTSGTIIIDVNDIEEDPPIVSDESFLISESASNGTTVGTVSTTGGTPVSFTIVSGDPYGVFQISSTGVITLFDNSTLIFATTSSYSLVIQASNSVGSDTGTTSITVTPVSTDLTSSNPRDFVKVNADTNIFGDLIMIGNQSLCDTSDHLTCSAPSSTATNNSVSQSNVHKDSNALAAGFANSTSSDLVLNPNDVVVEAWLYWIGRIDDSSTSTRASANTIQLKGPGQTTYTAITSLASKFNWMIDGSIFDYGGGANITSFVQAAGAGTYWVADLKATEMSNQGSGWAIAIIVQDTTQQTRTMKNISLYDGFLGVYNGSSAYPDSVTSTISGFRTPNSGTIDSNLIIFAGESDRGLDDSLSITNSTGAVYLKDSLNDTSNVQNATISRNGANVTTRSPNHENTLGIDIDEIDTSSVMEYNQITTDITVTSEDDRIFLAMYGFATELYIPQLCYDYAYQQNGILYTEDNNGSVNPRIRADGLDTSAPLTVELFFQNTEDSDIMFQNVTVDVYDINTSQATYIPNSTYVTNPGDVFPLLYNTLTGIPVDNIDSQDIFYLDYDLDPITSDINMPLNARVNYEIVFSDGSSNTSTIPYTSEIGSEMPLCSALNFSYEPTFAIFNVEDTALAGDESSTVGQYYNLPTQTANRPGDFQVAAYDVNAINTRKNVSTIIAVELIDAGKFHGIDAACTEPGSALTPRIWVTFGEYSNNNEINTSLTDFNADTIQAAIDNNIVSTHIIGGDPIASPGDFYRNVRENTAFRLSRSGVGDDGNDVIQLEPDACQGNQVEPCYKVLNFPDLSAVDLGAGAGNCVQDIDSNPLNADKIPQVCGNAGSFGLDRVQLAICMECIYGYNYIYNCSRDNFAVRPESFRVSLKDQDQSDDTIPKNFIALNNDTTVVHDTSNVSTTGYQIVAGYKYALEINATNHENETPTPGYRASFLLDGDNGTRTFKLKWHEITNNANCNDIEDQNKIVTLVNGQAEHNITNDPNPSFSDQVGKYDLNLFDKLWTKVDWDPTAMAHHTGTHFLTGTDCVENTSYVPQLGELTVNTNGILSNISGCDINTSNHTNSNTGVNYTDIPVRVHPYTFNQSSVLPAIGPYTRTNGQTFVYIDTPPTLEADNTNMSYNMNGIFFAAGYDNGRLTNFVTGCYADDLNMDLNFTYNSPEPASNKEPFLSYSLKDHNSTDSTVVYRPTSGTGLEVGTHTSSTTPLVIQQAEGFFAKEMEGAIAMDLGYNFNRTYNNTLNPRYIEFKDFNITYVTNPTGVKADLKSDHQIFGNKVLDTNVTFVYGRAKPSQDFYDDVTASSIATPISIVAFCDLGYTECQDRGIMAAMGAATNEDEWWLSVDHTTGDGDGNVTLAIGSITEGAGSPAVTPASPTSISTITNATDNTVNVSSGANPTLPMTVEIDLTTSNTPPLLTNRWLIYNPYSATVAPSPFYKVRFIGDSLWTGVGQTGNVVGTGASTKKSQRMDW